MKKILSLILVVLTLSACSAKDEVEPRLSGISFNADITYYNENYKGECNISEDGVLTVKITEPEILSGYTVTLSGEEITAEYMGVSFTPNLSNMPFSSVITEFYKKITMLSASETAEKKGDTYIIKGGDGVDAYTLYISPTGFPQSLEMPDERFTVYFYNQSLKP